MAAGIGLGMTVLDLGCGAGDVSFVAAELVGPQGQVIGVDACRQWPARRRASSSNEQREVRGECYS